MVGDGTLATGINNSAQIVGAYFGSGHIAQGFLYSGGSYTTLVDPTAFGGPVAFGINAKGDIVGNYIDSSHVSYGFLDSGGTYTTLDDPSASHSFDQGTTASGINKAGQIVGYYFDQTGAHGFLAIPSVPEPSTWALMLIGFAALSLAAAKRRTHSRANYG